MKFNESWLREWVNPNISSSHLCDQIINSGIEIEKTSQFQPKFHQILVGKIVFCATHPSIKILKIVQVDIGLKKLLQIICKASNCRKNIKVAVATIYSFLPNHSQINIKQIYGEKSEGILCSFLDLGLFQSNSIIEFSSQVKIGDNVKKYLHLKDHIIQVSTTNNRPDGLSILGLARNIAAVNDLPLPLLKPKKIIPKIKKKLLIDIKAKQECINFFGRIIQNVNVNAETPFWMKKKLFLCDNLSENVITNIINYVLIEIGQPINILNADNIDSVFIARMANVNEEIYINNKNKILLNNKILVFSDKNQILSIPGNINSYNATVKKNTKNVFVSSFLINKITLLYISKKFSANKILDYYNYGIDPELQLFAIEYVTDLIIKICGGDSGPLNKKTENALQCKKHVIKLHHNKFYKVTGILLHENVISKILCSLNYYFIFKQTYWNIIPPSWRFDILIEEDVINEILRIYGYNNISPAPLEGKFNFQNKHEVIDILLNKARMSLLHKGYFETINYGFINPKIHKIMFPEQKTILISNPISQDMSCMRFSLWPGLVKNTFYNHNRQQESMRFFESGFCFTVDNEEPLGIKQNFLLGGIISGNYFKDKWYSKTRKVDFYDIKGDVESLLEFACNLNELSFQCQIIPGLHPQQSAAIYFKDVFIGKIGAIDPRIERKLNVLSSTFLFEISLNNFCDVSQLKIKKLSKFPILRRDISILISKNITYDAILKECKQIFIQHKVEINLFDMYFSKNFDLMQKSLGISFIFYHNEKTLTDKEVNLMIDNCVQRLSKKFHVILRKNI